MMSYKSLKNILDTTFGQGDLARDGVNYQLSCPFCKGKKKLHVRLDDFRYHCWVCDAKGRNVWKLVSKIRPDLVSISNLPKSSTNFIPEDQVKEEKVVLPERLVPVFRKSRDPDILSVKKYLGKRGVSLEKMMRWRIMSATSGKYRRHALIPSFDKEGEINYFVARSIDEGSFRYRNAKARKSDVIFNEVDVDFSKPVVLVEGVFDAIKCPENTVPILGSSMVKNSLLYKRLVRNQTDVIISLDPDMPEKAYKISDILIKAGCEVSVCFAPEGKDMGDLTYDRALSVLASAKSYNCYTKLTQRIGTIRSGSVI